MTLMLAYAMPALAAPEAPVRAIMDLATAMSSNAAPQGADYFDANHIGLFSKGFLAAYTEAKKYSYLEDGGVFEYDVITNSQEGCPLKDVSIAPGAESSGESKVTVTFKLMSCYQDDSLSEVHFKVVTEDGKPVISDIDRIIDGKPVSLMAEMQDIAKEGASAPADQQEPQPQ
ncbi:MAG: hypothetical protein EON57_10950 [Alphaproteobacteria bacterium]|nr:MAG: hypothetical protein EON57_10950 [Alphaproteobacteria bacterium]